MLVFEISKESGQLEIHADKNGLVELKKQLDFLSAGQSHVHLKTPSWAGDELTEEAQCKGDLVIHHVKIFLWKS